jgi:hypothetical protein
MILLPQPFKCWITGRYHHAWLCVFLFKALILFQKILLRSCWFLGIVDTVCAPKLVRHVGLPSISTWPAGGVLSHWQCLSPFLDRLSSPSSAIFLMTRKEQQMGNHCSSIVLLYLWDQCDLLGRTAVWGQKTWISALPLSLSMWGTFYLSSSKIKKWCCRPHGMRVRDLVIWFTVKFLVLAYYLLNSGVWLIIRTQ